jgi:hypothetical protein
LSFVFGSRNAPRSLLTPFQLVVQERQIQAFVGFAIRVEGHALDPRNILSFYEDASILMAFVGFLKARNVGAHHVVHHLSLAKKVGIPY